MCLFSLIDVQGFVAAFCVKIHLLYTVKAHRFCSFRELPEGVMNYATPLLDLSNLFGLEEGKINLNINFEGKYGFKTARSGTRIFYPDSIPD
jgi:hypothetical protein